MLGNPTTVLLIEDEALIRIGTSAMLEDGGYFVLEAANADEAKEILTEHPEIEIVMTDVQMPGSMDGLEFASFVSRNHPQIVVLITSGHAFGQDERTDETATYISKPYSAATIERALQGLRSRRST